MGTDIAFPDGVETIEISKLRLNGNNPRIHSNRQIKQLAQSIKLFGFTNPVLIDRDNNVVAGHGRIAGAASIGLKEVPCLRVEWLTPEKVRAYTIADNRLAECATWDDAQLAIEFRSLSELSLDFEITATGFEFPEIEALWNAADRTEKDEVPPPTPDLSKAAITKSGDIWTLGDHRLICGDARDPTVYARLLGDERAQMVFTDPPYGVPIAKHVLTGRGKHKHREFVMASGEMSDAEIQAFLSKVLENLAEFCVDGAVNYVCMDWRHLLPLLLAAKPHFSELKNLCVWNKTNAGMGVFYRSQHELILVYKRGKAKHINNFALGQHGRHRTNIWCYPGMSSFGSEREKALSLHPTVKPVALIADAIRDCSNRGGLILDAFSGSGSTVVAAEETERRARVIELDPHYCDVTIRRWQECAGESAVNTATGVAFPRVEEPGQ